MNKYIALLWPLLGGVVMVALMAYNEANTDGAVDASEWVTVVIQAFTVIIVWATANLPGFTRAKPFVSAVMLVLNLLVSYVVGGLSGVEVTQLIVAFLGAVGVYVTPGPVHVRTSATPISGGSTPLR